MKILAIDPGNKESAYVLMDGYEIVEFDKVNNEFLLYYIDKLRQREEFHAVIEMVASYGLPVGKDVFETCVFIGRIIEHCKSHDFMYRKDVKMNLCHTLKGTNDTTVKHALIDRFAMHDFRTGKGTKKNNDWFYGFSNDVWSAYAVGVTYLDNRR